MTIRPLVVTLVLDNQLSSLAERVLSSGSLEGGNCSLDVADYFFSENPRDVAHALKICAGCPIRQKCLQVAIERGEEGIWGGTTHAQRLKMQPVVKDLELPTLKEAKSELHAIMFGDASEMAQKYGVERRTVQRWRTSIKANSFASQLVGVQH